MAIMPDHMFIMQPCGWIGLNRYTVKIFRLPGDIFHLNRLIVRMVRGGGFGASLTFMPAVHCYR